MQKRIKIGQKQAIFAHFCPILVEATGLEPTTFWSLTKRATKLRYASIYVAVSRFPRSTAYIIIPTYVR